MEEIKENLPCFTGETEEGVDYNNDNHNKAKVSTANDLHGSTWDTKALADQMLVMKDLTGELFAEEAERNALVTGTYQVGMILHL